MTILPKLRVRSGENIGNELFIQHPDIAENEQTFLTTDVNSGVSSLSVDNGLKFTVGEYIIIGQFGAEKSEIIRIHTSTTPTSTTITLASATNFAHNRGDRITFIPYNQLAIERSTDAGVNYSALATVDIRADSTETFYQHAAGAATDYYRVRFSNSATSNTSSYSDGIIATGYADNSAGAVFRAALQSMGEKIDGEVITKEFLFQALDEGRDEIDRHEKIERWSFRTVFDYDAGDVIPGRYQLTLPTDLRDGDTYKNILSLRIGRDKWELEQVDRRKLESWYRGVVHTTLNGSITTASTSIVLTSSGDFDESGAVDIAAESISEDVDTADYTTNTESTATLGTVTNITSNHATARDVWQGASFGLPVEYNVDNGIATFSQPFPNDLAGENIWLSYYQTKTKINSEADTFDEPFYQIYIPYMRFRIKLRKNPSMAVSADIDFAEWQNRMQQQVNKEFVGQDIRIVVDTPRGSSSTINPYHG